MFREGFRELDADIVTLQETMLTDDTDQARVCAVGVGWRARR